MIVVYAIGLTLAYMFVGGLVFHTIADEICDEPVEQAVYATFWPIALALTLGVASFWICGIVIGLASSKMATRAIAALRYVGRRARAFTARGKLPKARTVQR